MIDSLSFSRKLFISCQLLILAKILEKEVNLDPLKIQHLYILYFYKNSTSGHVSKDLYLYANVCDVDTLGKNYLLQVNSLESCQPLKIQKHSYTLHHQAQLSFFQEFVRVRTNIQTIPDPGCCSRWCQESRWSCHSATPDSRQSVSHNNSSWDGTVYTTW